jgi:alpha/beta superfamily hydrolase
MFIDIPGPAGTLEAVIDAAATPRAVAVFAHPHPQYGGTMHTKAVFQSAKALARIGCEVLRFNFRGVGRSTGSFGEGVGEVDDFRAAAEFMEARRPDLPKWAVGFSFGSWVAASTGASDPRVERLIMIAPPVDRYDWSPVVGSTRAKFILHGNLDEVVPIKSVWRFYASLPEPKEIAVIDGADHLFDGKVLDLADAVEDLLGGPDD